MENDERRKIIEIEQNTIQTLVRYFDKLLNDLDTKFKLSEIDRKNLKISIGRLVDYRIKEGKIDKNKDLFKVLKKINGTKFSLGESKEIYSMLLKLSPGYRGTYNKNKRKEESNSRGEGIISKFFRMVFRK